MALDSPVLQCNNGVFMFPDMMAPAQGYYVGVVLSSELPAADRELFRDLLSQMTDLRVQVSVARRSASHQHKTSLKLGKQTHTVPVLYGLYLLFLGSLAAEE